MVTLYAQGVDLAADSEQPGAVSLPPSQRAVIRVIYIEAVRSDVYECSDEITVKGRDEPVTRIDETNHDDPESDQRQPHGHGDIGL